MNNLIRTDFDTTVEELNSLNEQYSDTADFNANINSNDASLQQAIKTAQNTFKANASKLILDYPNFHLGYDLMLYSELCNFYNSHPNYAASVQYAKDHAEQLMNAMFDDNGRWKGRSTYQYIKTIITPLGNKELDRAMKTAWGLKYTSDTSKLATSAINMSCSIFTASTNVANDARQRAIDFVKDKLTKGIFDWTGGFNENSSFDNASFNEKFLTFLCMSLSVEPEIQTMPMAIRDEAISQEKRELFINGLQKIRQLIYNKDSSKILELQNTIIMTHSELEKGGPYYTG